MVKKRGGRRRTEEEMGEAYKQGHVIRGEG